MPINDLMRFWLKEHILSQAQPVTYEVHEPKIELGQLVNGYRLDCGWFHSKSDSHA